MKKIITITILIGITSCNQTKSGGDKKTMDFRDFTIETPASWKPIKEKGIDSYVGRIAIDDMDTLSFDLGWYSNKLYEDEQAIMDSSMMGSINPDFVDTSVVIFVKDRMKVDPDIYRKINVSWDSIDGRKAKIVYPRQSGVGMAGVYIDSLWISGSGVDRFNLYGVDLKPENEKKVLSAIKTLKFKKMPNL